MGKGWQETSPRNAVAHFGETRADPEEPVAQGTGERNPCLEAATTCRGYLSGLFRSKLQVTFSDQQEERKEAALSFLMLLIYVSIHSINKYQKSLLCSGHCPRCWETERNRNR